MPYKQGHLVILKSPQKLPDGQVLSHPVLIISSKRSGYEPYYTGVMMTASSHKDRYSFRCDNTMFESPLEKTGCQLRLYLVFGFIKDDISSLKNTMKKIPLQSVLEQVREYIFNFDNS